MVWMTAALTTRFCPMSGFGRLTILLAAIVVSACEPGTEDGERERGRLDGEPGADRPAMGMGGMMRMMGNMPAGVAASELPDSDSEQARLIARYCSQCHGIPTPRRLSAGEWPSTLRRMVVRMERMAGMPMHSVRAPSPEETEGMLRYLRAHALRTATTESLPTDDPGGQLFARACSRCHALPDPAQYPPEEWPEVVERMRENMRGMEVEEITDEEARRIIQFLQRTSEGADTIS